MKTDHFSEFQTRMRQAKMSDAIIRSFRHSYRALLEGQTGILPESSIEPVTNLPRLETVTSSDDSLTDHLARTVVIKLNGGLGTSMGLDGPKSLLTVKQNLTFLDIIARQIRHRRTQSGVKLRFVLMNSFSTSRRTADWIRQNPDIGSRDEVELMQSRIPKVDAATLRPATWPANPDLEWCPPGHGDLYPSLLGSGWLDRLLKAGMRYLFVSNSDNLGATVDDTLLSYFVQSDRSFLMEACERTAADRKGGHLAQRNGRLVLRESAQCMQADQAAFQDIDRHRFFNTNNLWLRLERLKRLLDQNDGIVPLPVIQNQKTVDPRDAASPKVVQLETAMGAAIECFEDAGAIVVPRSRFAPVKTTSDLLAVRSDAYELTPDFRVALVPSRDGKPPAVQLDAQHGKQMDQLEASLRDGIPSLKECSRLRTEGPVIFCAANVFRGDVTLRNPSSNPTRVPEGVYENTVVNL